MWLIGYGCSTAAGPGRKQFWQSLTTGATAPISVAASGILKNKTEALPDYRIHLRRDLATSLSHRERLAKKLEDSWNDLKEMTSEKSITSLNQGRTGMILASTKGFGEDHVWTAMESSAAPSDTLTPLLTDFLNLTRLKPSRQAVVSNACSSVGAALKLAQSWFDAKAVDRVIVISADTVGEFVVRGFHSLQALTTADHATAFDQNRSGLQLGEATAVLLLSSTAESSLHLRAVGLNCEGVAATRPDEEGRSLFLALSEAVKEAEKPQAIIAHGTATPLNDSTEDFVFSAIFNGAPPPQVTGVKWCTGHTLGASCALDLIAAAQVLENKSLFALPFTKKIDARFKSDYVLKSKAFHGSSLLVSSLGFGGVHAGLHLVAE